MSHVKRALEEKWGYVMGTFGLVLTDNLLEQKLNQYPTYIAPHLDFIKANWLGKRTADCIGLIKSYIWWENGNLVYDPKTDVNETGMFNLATEKGPLSTMPNIPGICVWRPGHIGVYIGDGQVIEARNTRQGVVQTALNSEGWSHWLKCPYIQYDEKKLTWEEILTKLEVHPGWIPGIKAAVNMTNAEGWLGEIEILKYLPGLIEKVYHRE